LVTIVGIPLGLGILAALALIYILGYTATAWIVGRRILGAGLAGSSPSCSAGPSCGSRP
jgi:hypothetical protein